jgi:ArsR family transcriptional regulator
MSAGSPIVGVGSGRAIAPLSDDLVDLIADRFRALAEPTRIKLLDRLREGEASVLELTSLVGTTQQNVSKHLNLLQHAGIVGRRKQGNFSYYRISDDTVYTLCEAVCGSLQSHADALRRTSTRPAVEPRDQADPLQSRRGEHSWRVLGGG